jgi:hypothetical protein
MVDKKVFDLQVKNLIYLPFFDLWVKKVNFSAWPLKYKS